MICASLTIAVLAFSPGLQAQDTSADSQIRAIVAAQVTAWNAGDGTANSKDVAPDASFTNVFGMVMYGATAFAERNRQVLATFYKIIRYRRDRIYHARMRSRTSPAACDHQPFPA